MGPSPAVESLAPGLATNFVGGRPLGRLLDALDHPVMFAFAMTLVVIGFASLITYGAKAAGWPGLAALSQHP